MLTEQDIKEKFENPTDYAFAYGADEFYEIGSAEAFEAAQRILDRMTVSGRSVFEGLRHRGIPICDNPGYLRRRWGREIRPL